MNPGPHPEYIMAGLPLMREGHSLCGVKLPAEPGMPLIKEEPPEASRAVQPATLRWSGSGVASLA